AAMDAPDPAIVGLQRSEAISVPEVESLNGCSGREWIKEEASTERLPTDGNEMIPVGLRLGFAVESPCIEVSTVCGTLPFCGISCCGAGKSVFSSWRITSLCGRSPTR